MEIIGLILSFLLAIAVGWNILFFIIRRDLSFPLAEKIALSYVIGLGALTVQMFLYSLTGIRFSVISLLIPHICLAVVGVFAFAKTPPTGSKPAETKNGTFDILLLAGILFQVFHAFFKALIKPMHSFDSIGNFAFKAKMLFMEGHVPYELFLNRSIDIQQADFPLFIPLSETWVYMFLGKWNDLLVKTLFPMFFVALLVIFYFVLKRIIGKRLALVSTFFLVTIPHFLNYATIGYADFALLMFYSASFFYMFLWISYRRENKYLFLAASLSLFAIWTKNEGVMLSLINIIIVFLFAFFARKDIKKLEIRSIFYFAFIIIALCTIWFGYLNALGMSHVTVNKESLKLSLAIKNLNRIPLILYEWQKHVFGPKKWNISLLVFFAGLIVYFKTAFKSHFKYITLSILLTFAGYSAVYLITPFEIRYHLRTTGSRLLLHFLPIVVFWIGYLAKEILNAEGNIHR